MGTDFVSTESKIYKIKKKLKKNENNLETLKISIS